MGNVRVLLLVGLAGCGVRLGTNERVLDDGGQPIDQLVVDPDDGTDIDAPLGKFGAPAPVPGIAPVSDDDPTLTGDLLELYFNRANDIFVARRANVADPFGPVSAVAELNTASQETTPEISYDGLMIFWSSDRITAGNNDIFVATRATRNDPFGTITRVDELSTASREAASASSDKLAIVFESNRMTDNFTFIATRANTAQPFGPPQPVTNVNLATFSTGNPMLSANALELYVNTNRDGNNELYRATRATTNDAFGPATLITELSAATDESDPWISPDGRTLFFVANPGGVNTLMFSTR
jgi:hypothetical protein